MEIVNIRTHHTSRHDRKDTQNNQNSYEVLATCDFSGLHHCSLATSVVALDVNGMSSSWKGSGVGALEVTVAETGAITCTGFSRTYSHVFEYATICMYVPSSVPLSSRHVEVFRMATNLAIADHCPPGDTRAGAGEHFLVLPQNNFGMV